MSDKIISEWLQQRAATAVKGQLQEHLNLISKNVKLLGVPGHSVIDYTTWSEQCKREFEHQLLTSIDYRNIRTLATNSSSIRFAVYELLAASDGSQHTHHLEINSAREDDGQWRVTEERVITSETLETSENKFN